MNSLLNYKLSPREVGALFLLAWVLVSVGLLVWLNVLRLPNFYNNQKVQLPTGETFSGRVVRILPNGQNYVLELADLQATSAATRVTKSFIVKGTNPGNPLPPTGSTSASPKSYDTQFGNIQVGDVLSVTYFGNTSPYNVISLENSSVKDNTRQPAFLHGFVIDVVGDTMKMISTEGGNYTIKIQDTVLIGPMYEKVGNAERPGKLKPVTDFSSLKVWQEISVFYTRNDGETIIPDSVLTF